MRNTAYINLSSANVTQQILSLLFVLSLLACVGVACTDETQAHQCDTESGTDEPSGDNASNTTTNNSNTTDGATDEKDTYNYVLIEGDLRFSNAPTVQIDAVGISLADGSEMFASFIEDSDIIHPSLFQDPTKLLNAPDTECGADNFVSLGPGYIIVGFDEGFSSGDSIKVYTVQLESQCPTTDVWINPESVFVSVGKSNDSFVAVDTNRNEAKTFTAP